MTSTVPALGSLQEARQYATSTTCPGCGRNGTCTAYEVQKEGPNMGRLFLKCRHCGHFGWLTPPRDGTPEDPATSATPCPKCDKPRKALRVKKEGPNQGRLFLTCSDPACDSFEWASPARPGASTPERREGAPFGGRTTEDAFLTDVRAEPDNDPLRLIYADWLEEHGHEARAELIRVQVALASLPAGDERRADLARREQEILGEHGAAWASGVAPLVRAWEFRRGLLEHVEVDAERFALHADELFRLAPILSIQAVINGWPQLRTLLQCRAFARVVELSLVSEGEVLYSTGARILAESPAVAGLRSLSLPGQSLGRPGVAALAGSRYLGKLQRLDLSNNHLGAGSLALLASSSHLAGLTSLKLGANPLLTPGDLRTLFGSSRLTNLRALDLSGCALDSESAEALARSSLFAGLTRLDLSGCQLSFSARRAVEQSPRRNPKLVVRV